MSTSFYVEKFMKNLNNTNKNYVVLEWELRGALQDIRNASRHIKGDSKLQNNKHGFKAEWSKDLKKQSNTGPACLTLKKIFF